MDEQKQGLVPGNDDKDRKNHAVPKMNSPDYFEPMVDSPALKFLYPNYFKYIDNLQSQELYFFDGPYRKSESFLDSFCGLLRSLRVTPAIGPDLLMKTRSNLMHVLPGLSLRDEYGRAISYYGQMPNMIRRTHIGNFGDDINEGGIKDKYVLPTPIYVDERLE